MSNHRIYEPGGINVTWNGIDLSSGWAEDTFLTIEPNSARVSYTAGADGKYAYTKHADKGCTITLTLQQTSPTNDDVAKVYAVQDTIGGKIEVSPFTVEDPQGGILFAALNAVLTEVPTNDFGNSVGERSWVWVAESYLFDKDPSTITSALSDYIKQ